MLDHWVGLGPRIPTEELGPFCNVAVIGIRLGVVVFFFFKEIVVFNQSYYSNGACKLAWLLNLDV